MESRDQSPKLQSIIKWTLPLPRYTTTEGLYCAPLNRLVPQTVTDKVHSSVISTIVQFYGKYLAERNGCE